MRKPCRNNVSVTFHLNILFFRPFVSFSVHRGLVIARERQYTYLIHKETPRDSSLIKRSPFRAPQTGAHGLTEISALTLLFLRRFRDKKKVQRGREKEIGGTREREREEEITRACMSAHVCERYRVNERHACPEPVNVNYCGIGSSGCCKGMIHGWRKGLRECKRG